MTSTKKRSKHESVSYRILQVLDAEPASFSEPYILRTTKTPIDLDLKALHNACYEKITNSWHTGDKPKLGCQGIYSVGPVAYYNICKQLRITAGFYNRAWKQKGVRGVWWSDEIVNTGKVSFRRLLGPNIPSKRVLLVAPPFVGGGIIMIPPYKYDPSFYPPHGIANVIDYSKLSDPDYLKSIDERDKGTYSIAKGGVLRIPIISNSIKESSGIYIDKIDFAHFHAQCKKFRDIRSDPDLTSPREFTPIVTSLISDYHVLALYMLHGLGHAHVSYGKVVADFGFAGNGGLANKGKLKSVKTKDGVNITSTKEYMLHQKNKNIKSPDPDFLIQGGFKYTPDEIISAFSEAQKVLFAPTLIEALHKVYKIGAENFLDKNMLNLLTPENDEIFLDV